MNKGYSIKAKDAGSAEIFIYEEIGVGMFGVGVSAKQFAEDLKAMGKLNTINLRLNSPGGSVFEGFAIYNTLKRNPARVVVDIDGMALSIASIVAMAGDEINMAENSMLMIHDPWTIEMGTAQDMRKAADVLDKLRGNLVDTYLRHVSADEDQVSNWMTAETWFTAAEAVDLGFADAVTQEMKMAACFDLSKYKFKHAPQQALVVPEETRTELITPLLDARRKQIQSMQASTVRQRQAA